MKYCVSTNAGTQRNWLTFEPDPDHSPDPGTVSAPNFAFQRIIWKSYGHIWRSYGQISMKFYVPIAAGVCTIWLGFELDTDHSPDPWTGFFNFSVISEEAMDAFRWNFRLCVDSCGGTKEVHVFACVRLSVCLLARLLKNECTNLDEMLHVDRCRDMDELINFWAWSGL